MKDLKKIITEKFDQFLVEEKLAPLIEEKIEHLIERAVSDQLSVHSEFGKEVKNVISSKMNVDLSKMDMLCYGKVIQSAINRVVSGAANKELIDKIGKSIDKMLGAAPAEITLNKLCEGVLCEYWKGSFDLPENLIAELEERDAPLSGYSLKVAEEGGHHGSLFDLYIVDGKIAINHSMAYNPTCMNKMEQFIFQCYAAGTEITNIDDFDCNAGCFYNPYLDDKG